MSLINTEEAAKRLARVILSDIEIYNTEKIRAGLDLRREIDEGEKLFRSRVTPELASLFALAVSQKGLGGGHAVTTPMVEMVAGPGSRLDADGGLITTVDGARRLAGSVLLEIQNNV